MGIIEIAEGIRPFIGLIIGVGFFVGVILYVRLKQGCFFKPSFDKDFPRELRPYARKNPRRCRAGMIAPLVKRYKEAKEREGTFFSVERFLDGEEELIRRKKIRR